MNPLKGETPLVLADGRTLTLAMDFHALVVAERAYGKPLAQTLADGMAGFVGASVAIFFGALQTHQPRMTLAEAEAIFGSDGEAVQAALDAASEAAYPKAAEDREVGNAPAKPRAGKNSGRSGAKSGSTRTGSGGRRQKPSS